METAYRKMDLDTVFPVQSIKDGFIIDLGPIGKLYPAVSSKWVEDAEDSRSATCSRE